MTQSRYLVVIPARKGSKGVPDKNIRTLDGKPLVSYSLELAAQLDGDVFVSTDDERVVELAKSFNLEPHVMRPEDLADDQSPMIPVLQHAVREMEAKQQVTYDYVLLLQPTAPFRTLQDVQSCLSLIQDSGTDSVISVKQVDSVHPILMKKIEDGRLVSFCIEEKEGTRRQDYDPPAYMRNGAIYLTKREVLMTKDSIWGDSITPYVMPEERSVSIDSDLDFKLAEMVAADDR